MRNYLLAFFLIVSINSQAQHKRFCFAAMAGMSNASIGYDYKNVDFLMQYNFKRTFSIVSGFGMETGDFSISDFHEFPMPYHTDAAMVDFSNWNMPLMSRATFGKRRLFLYLQAGIVMYGNPKATGEVTRTYSLSSGYPKEHFSRTYHISGGMDLIYGGGVSICLTKNLNLFGEVRDNPSKQSTPRSQEDSGFNTYSHYQGVHFSVGFSWQFNIQKDSDYTMKTAYPKSNKSTETE